MIFRPVIFTPICFSWILDKISEISKKGENFNGIGYIIYTILQYFQSKQVLDIIVTCLFSAEISNKTHGCKGVN